jgi:hypothetical protein
MRLPSRTRLRHRTLRRLTLRLCIWVLAPALVVLLLRAVWARQADRHMQAVRDRLHAQGIRVYLADFPDGAALPRDQNSVFDLLDAWRLSPPLTEPQWTLLGEGPSIRRPRGWPPPGALGALTPAEVAEIQRIFAAYAPSIAALDAAGGRPQAVWPRSALLEPLRQFYGRYPTNSTASPGPRLFTLLDFMAKIAYHDSHDDEALRHMRRRLSTTRILLESPRDDAHDMAIQYRDSSLRLLETMLPNMDLHTAAVADEAREILCLVLDDPNAHESRAYSQEGLITRAFELEVGNYNEHEWWMLTPMATASHARAAQIFASYLAEFSAASWPQANTLRPPVPAYPTTVAQILSDGWARFHVPSEDYGGRSNSETTRFGESVTNRRATALLLAARLYTAQHGSPPPSAAALVPQYLPAVLLDPFSSRNQPLHFRNDPTGPTVWSVGENDVDDVSTDRFHSTGDDPHYGALNDRDTLPR